MAQQNNRNNSYKHHHHHIIHKSWHFHNFNPNPTKPPFSIQFMKTYIYIYQQLNHKPTLTSNKQIPTAKMAASPFLVLPLGFSHKAMFLFLVSTDTYFCFSFLTDSFSPYQNITSFSLYPPTKFY